LNYEKTTYHRHRLFLAAQYAPKEWRKIMKIQVIVSTKYIGSKSTQEIEIDDSELEDLSEAERDDYIEEIARDTMFEMIEWNWNEVEEN
jgi:hypothetical protein